MAKVDVQESTTSSLTAAVDPEAIRDFLTYAYTIGTGGGPPRPRNTCCLVGDGHYDFTGAQRPDLPNLIPPYLVDVDPSLGETAADNRYVSVDGPDDYLPDMAIGRIPAKTPADVTAAVNKIIAYETAAPAGDWQNRAVFVAETTRPRRRLPRVEQRGAAALAARRLRRPHDLLQPRLFTGDDMRTAIKAAFNDDAFMIQWIGHGSEFRWGSVSMFNTFDPPEPGRERHVAVQRVVLLLDRLLHQPVCGSTGQMPGRDAAADPAARLGGRPVAQRLHVGGALLTLTKA